MRTSINSYNGIRDTNRAGICCNTATNAATFAMYSLRGIPFPDAISFVGHFCQRLTPIYNVFKKYYFVDSNSEDYGILFQRKMFMGGQLIRYILAAIASRARVVR